MKMMIDTNILIYLSMPILGKLDEARTALEREFPKNAEFVICPFVLREFARAMTGKFKIDTNTTDQLIASFLAGYDLVDEKEFFSEWRYLFTSYNLMGNSVYDASIVAIMAVHGITHILTNNPKDFVRYRHISIVPMSE